MIPAKKRPTAAKINELRDNAFKGKVSVPVPVSVPVSGPVTQEVTTVQRNRAPSLLGSTIIQGLSSMASSFGFAPTTVPQTVSANLVNLVESVNKDPILLFLDISGSMNNPCTDSINNRELANFTRLFAAVKAAKFFVTCIPLGTPFGLYLFDDLILSLLDVDKLKSTCDRRYYPNLSHVEPMTEEYRNTLLTNLNKVDTRGGTDILNVLNTAGEIVNRNGLLNTRVIFLTDGQHEGTICQPTKITTEFKNLSCYSSIKDIECFGFGKDADTGLLKSIASFSKENGHYIHLPSGGDVCPTFSMSILRHIYPTNIMYCITPTDHSETSLCSSTLSVLKDFLNNLSAILLEEQYKTTKVDGTEEITNYAILTGDLTKKLKIRKDNIAALYTRIENWIETSYQNTSQSDYAKYILNLYYALNDETGRRGQICSALILDEWERWGRNYWISTGLAIAGQYISTSRDLDYLPFGTKIANENALNIMKKCYDDILTKDDQENAQRILEEANRQAMEEARQQRLSAQQAENLRRQREEQARRQADAANSSTSMGSGGGCFLSTSKVDILISTVESGEFLYDSISIRNVKKGDFLRGFNNQPVEVEVVVTTHVYGTFSYCQVGSTSLTPKHPIFSNSKWVHPDTISDTITVDNFNDNIFNLVLSVKDGKRSESVFVDGELCVCLGHGISDGSAAVDSFWGGSVINDLTRLYPEQFSTGHIVTNHRNIVGESGVIGFELNE